MSVLSRTLLPCLLFLCVSLLVLAGQEPQPTPPIENVMEVPLTDPSSQSPKEEDILEVPIKMSSPDSPTQQAQHAKEEYLAHGMHMHQTQGGQGHAQGARERQQTGARHSGTEYHPLNPLRLAKWLSKTFADKKTDQKPQGGTNQKNAAQAQAQSAGSASEAASSFSDWARGRPSPSARSSLRSRDEEARNSLFYPSPSSSYPSPFFSPLSSWSPFSSYSPFLQQLLQLQEADSNWRRAQEDRDREWEWGNLVDFPLHYSLYTDPHAFIATRGDNQRMVSSSAQKANQLLSATWDVQQHADRYDVIAQLPGWHKDEVRVDVKDGRLTLSCERKSASQTETEGGGEATTSHFAFLQRSWTLPQDAVEQKVEAKFDKQQQQLKITFPRDQQAKKITSGIEIADA